MPDKDVSEFIGRSSEVHQSLRNFIKQERDSCEFVSLGENCSTSWYLKSVGLKRYSYPFDWLFSSPEIVLDCINDRFTNFLDKTLLFNIEGRTSAGHRHYHASLFNHRNPLDSDEDFAYYERCCERFLALSKSAKKLVFFITLINEPNKRAGWAQGFSMQYKMPEQQNIASLSPLFATLKQNFNNVQFIVLNHYTDSQRTAEFNQIDEDIAQITFCAKGRSTGVKYTDPVDDFCFKLIMAGANINSAAQP
jgi:hypothetical protein